MADNFRSDHSRLVNKSRGVKLIARNKAILKLLNQTQLQMKRRIAEDRAFYKGLLQKYILEVS